MTQGLQTLLLASGALFLASCPGLQYSPRTLIPIRGVLVQGEEPTAGWGGHGYVLLPDELEPARNRRACEAWLGTLSTETSGATKPRSAYLVTWWPVTKRPPTNAARRDCDWLVANYDHGFAMGILAQLGYAGARGPILIAHRQPHHQWKPDIATRLAGLGLCLDETEDDKLGESFRKWRQDLSNAPEEWGDDASYLTSLARLIDAYGVRIFGGNTWQCRGG